MKLRTQNLAMVLLITLIFKLPAWSQMDSEGNTKVDPIDSLSEAYEEQARRSFKRGDVAGATKLYEKSFNEWVNDRNDELYQAKMFNDLGECWRMLAENTAQRNLFNVDLTPEQCLDKAERVLRTSLFCKEAKSQERTDFLYIAESLETLARVYSAPIKPRLMEAEALYRKALAIRADKEGPESISCADDLFQLGNVLTADSHLSDAEKSYQKALAVYEKHGAATGLCHHKMAVMYYEWNKMSSAGRHYDDAIKDYAKRPQNSQSNTKSLKKDLPDVPLEAFAQARNELKSSKDKPCSPKEIYLLRNLIAAARRLGKNGEADTKFLENRVRRCPGSR